MKSILTLGAAALALTAPLAAAQASAIGLITQSYHFDSGTSLTTAGFPGNSGSLDFQFLPSTGAPATSLTISNIQVQGSWKVTAANGLSAVNAANAQGITVHGGLQTYSNLSADPSSSHLNSDIAPLSINVPNYGPNNTPGTDFSLPITTFGDSFSFDISETSPGFIGTPSTFNIKAIDAPLTLASLVLTPGTNQSVVLNSAPGTSLTGTNGTPNPVVAPVPEASTSISFGLTLMGLACVALRARRRSA